MKNLLTLISPKFLKEYSKKNNTDWKSVFQKLQSKSKFTTEDFEHYVIASSLYSSKIEGNTLDVNSFFRNKSKSSSPKKKEVQEIENLSSAYQFASESSLNKINFLKAHEILSKTLLPVKERGKIRKDMVAIRDSQTMRVAYLAVEPEFVQQELDKLFHDIDILIKQVLTYKEIFYYASMIHLWVALIHPFGDGNGRAARLIEKWFLASKIGPSAWSIPSEKYYWDYRPEYYQNIALGYNYYALHWERCIPFLLMLPKTMDE